MVEDDPRIRELLRTSLETEGFTVFEAASSEVLYRILAEETINLITMDILLELGWIKPRGRRRTPGRPVTYATADRFLEHFGLASLYDLPGAAEMKAAGLLDLSLPTGFEVPDPSRGSDADEEDPIEEGDHPEFAQDFVGD